MFLRKTLFRDDDDEAANVAKGVGDLFSFLVTKPISNITDTLSMIALLQATENKQTPKTDKKVVDAKKTLLTEVQEFNALVKQQNDAIFTMRAALHEMTKEARGLQEHQSKLIKDLDEPGTQLFALATKKCKPYLSNTFEPKILQLDEMLATYPGLPSYPEIPELGMLRLIKANRIKHHADTIALAVECLGDSNEAVRSLMKLPNAMKHNKPTTI